MARPISTEATVASAVVRSRKSRSGMIGSTATRASTKIAAASTARPARIMATEVGGGPAELRARQRDPDQQDRDPADDERRAEVVDVHLAPDRRQVQGLLEHQEGERGDRQPDVERAPPAQRRVHDDAADERAADGREREDRADVAGVPPALAGAHDARDDDLDQRGQATDAEALQGPGADQHLHAGRQPGDQRAGAEDHQGALHEHLLAEEVGELAPDRGGRGHREQRRDDDPGVAGLAALEVGHDPRERVGDHGAGEHRHEHREEEAGHGLEHLAVGHRGVGR